MDEAGHAVARGERRRVVGTRGARSRSPVRHRALLRGLHHEPPAPRCAERPGVRRVRVRRPTAATRSRRSGPARRPAPLPLEERQVGARPAAHGRRPSGLLGVSRLQQPRRPLERRAVQRRLVTAALEWQLATITAIHVETPKVKTFTLKLPGWRSHRAGQHYDVRLTAADGYRAQRSYSIASEPERSGEIDLTIELVEGGEVSVFMHEVAMVGDRIEVRGPIG